MSIRKQIRDRVAQILTSYSTDAGVRVYKAMYLPIAPSELPLYLCVYRQRDRLRYTSRPHGYTTERFICG